MLLHSAARDLKALRGAVGGDHEGDRPEPRLEILGVIFRVELDDEWRTDARFGKLWMDDRLAVDHDWSERACDIDARGDAIVDDGAENLHSAGRVADKFLHRLTQTLRNLIDRQVTFGSVDAAFRNVDILRRGAHLPGVQRERERYIARYRFEVAR